MSHYLEKMKSHIDELGWQSVEQLSERTLRMGFDMGEGRTQTVLITHYPTEGTGSDAVEVASAVIKMDGFPDGKLGKAMSEKLLRENATMAFANWAIQETGDGPYLVAMSGWLLDDLDAEELDFAVHIVSGVADRMEESMGVDNF